MEIEAAVKAFALFIIVLRQGKQQPLGIGVEQVFLVVLLFPDIITAGHVIKGIVEEMRVTVFDERIGAFDSVEEEVERLGGFALSTHGVIDCGHHLVAHAFVLLGGLFGLLIGIID